MNWLAVSLVASVGVAEAQEALPPALGDEGEAPSVDPVEAAAAGHEIFVAPFEALDPSAVGLASLLHSMMEMELSRSSTFELVPLSVIPKVFDMESWLYMESCPPGQRVGCAYVVGGEAGVAWALAGTVEPLDGANRIELHFVDVPNARDAIALQVDVALGEDQWFITQVSDLLGGLVRGETGAVQDIRNLGGPPPALVDPKAAATELEGLAKEIGGVESLEERGDLELEREHLSEVDILEMSEQEGSKPWERLGMTPDEYLRYRNSGMRLGEWREWARGRKNQIILRPFLGVTYGPLDTQYHGRYALDSDDLAVVETYAYQAIANSSGFWGGSSVAFGVTPQLEVGATFGYASGRFYMQVQPEIEGQYNPTPEPDSFLNPNFFAGPQATMALFPTSKVRPMLGASVLWWRSTGVGSHEEPPDVLPVYSAANLVLVGVTPGLEATLSRRLDVYLNSPLNLIVYGSGAQTYSEGSGVLLSKQEPPGLFPMSAGLALGFQVRLLGERLKKVQKLDFDDDPDE